MNTGRFFLGDWSVISKEIDDNSIDLILADAPFGTELKGNKFFNDSEQYVESQIGKWMFEMERVLKESSHILLYVPTLKLRMWLTAFEEYFTLMNIITIPCYTKNVYIKNNYPFDAQFLLFGTKGEGKNTRRLNQVDWLKTSKAWRTDKRNPNPKEFTYQYTSIFPKRFRANIKTNDIIHTRHPTEKNREAIDILIQLHSNENDIVLDCFMGVGSIPLMALALNRNAIGIEILPRWYKFALEEYIHFLRVSNLSNYSDTERREELKKSTREYNDLIALYPDLKSYRSYKDDIKKSTKKEKKEKRSLIETFLYEPNE